MSGSGERRHRNRLGRIPFLDSGGQDKGQPVGGDRRVKKGHPETRERDEW